MTRADAIKVEQSLLNMATDQEIPPEVRISAATTLTKLAAESQELGVDTTRYTIQLRGCCLGGDLESFTKAINEFFADNHDGILLVFANDTPVIIQKGLQINVSVNFPPETRVHYAGELVQKRVSVIPQDFQDALVKALENYYLSQHRVLSS